MRSTTLRSTMAVAVASTFLLAGCSLGSDNAADSSAPAGTSASNGAQSTDSTSTQSTSAAGSGSSTSGSSKSSDSSASGATGGTKSGSSTVVPNPTGYSKPSQVAGTPGTGCVPSRVDVPSVGITEPIVAMGTNSQGQIYPPKKTTMWYDKSPQPGTNGVSVVAGHVEYDGPDDFYELDRVNPGASVTVHCNNGRVLKWKVREKQSVLKTDLQTDQRVWGGSKTPVVALITCDRNSQVVNGHHLNNYVVWVQPA